MTMITPSYLGETIEYSSLHACRSTLEDPTIPSAIGSERLARVSRGLRSTPAVTAPNLPLAVLLDRGDPPEAVEPSHAGPGPDLEPRQELRALAKRASTQAVNLRIRTDARRVDGRPAAGTEAVLARRPALGGRLDVRRRRAGAKGERTRASDDGHPERRTGQRLAVGAVTDPRALRVDLGAERDVPTVAGSLDLHPLFRRALVV